MKTNPLDALSFASDRMRSNPQGSGTLSRKIDAAQARAELASIMPGGRVQDDAEIAQTFLRSAKTELRAGNLSGAQAHYNVAVKYLPRSR